MQMSFQTSAVVLLLIAAGVAMLTRKLHLPYSVALVATGMVLALLPFSPRISLTKDLLFGALLPPLIFEAALYLEWRELRRDLALILVLATLGVLISAAVTAAGMHSLAQWQWQSSIVFGILIAATDPVSVIATFREAKVHGRLRLLVESESLFNDGVAAVAFAIAIAATSGQSPTALGMTVAVVLAVGGGLLCGAIVAGVVLLLAGRTEDHLVELTFTTVAAYGSFLMAESFGVSGVLATLTAGLMLGNIGTLGVLSARGREAVRAFWEYAAFVSNSLVFLLIGMYESRQNFAAVWFAALVAIAFVMVGRAAAIYPICLAFSKSSLRVSAAHQHVLFWGGLRGALALALALGLPRDMPAREDIIAVSFAVVAFSLFVQGLTMAPLLRALRELPKRSVQ
jgi:monovalent cation:H+ antiporter, CPA1 family